MMATNRNGEASKDNCLFCKIVRGELPCQKVFENENVLGFEDIQPSSKVHNLFIHKKHTSDVNEMPHLQLGDIFAAIKEWCEDQGLSKSGFRVVTNVGSDAGQTVFHTHFHVLGGEALRGFGAR